MSEKSLLEGKKILIVDDEPDVLEVLEDLLKMCHVSKATNFNKAKEFLVKQEFDIAILDIMGVDGLYHQIFAILQGSNKKLQVHYDGKLRVIAADIQRLPFDGLDPSGLSPCKHARTPKASSGPGDRHAEGLANRRRRPCRPWSLEIFELQTS